MTDWGKIAVLDCLGVAMAGSREECSRVAAELARREHAAQEASVYGHGFRTAAAQAAFVNGISAHATDFDHSFVAGGQPTAAVIPAVFALGEAIGASGHEILEAYRAGFDVAARLALAGIRPGALGAAAACAKLLGCYAGTALGIATAMGASAPAAPGTMAKPLAVGIAARNGVLAAQLGAAGFKAASPDLPPPTEIFAVRLKPYPCGGLTHTAIYAAIELRREHGIAPEDIAGVEVRTPQYTADTLGSKTPETGLQGKFSIAYLVARALMDGSVTLASFTDDAIREVRVRELMRKIEVAVDPEMVSSDSPDGSRPASVAITLNSGQIHRRFEQYPKGSPHVPMSHEELLEKVRACGLAEDAIALIDRLETLPDIRPLAQAMLKR